MSFVYDASRIKLRRSALGQTSASEQRVEHEQVEEGRPSLIKGYRATSQSRQLRRFVLLPLDADAPSRGDVTASNKASVSPEVMLATAVAVIIAFLSSRSSQPGRLHEAGYGTMRSWKICP